MKSDQGILYIEPAKARAAEPLIDELTMLMAGALRAAESGTGTSQDFSTGGGYRGWHTCACGAMSSNCEYRLPGGEVTNSLATHYLALHRDEVPEDQLAKVRALKSVATPVKPTGREMGYLGNARPQAVRPQER